MRTGRRLGFAVVGLGGFGMKRLKTLAKSPQVRIVSVFDTDRSKAEKVATDFDARPQTFDAIVRDSEIDVIDIASPNKYHAEYVLAGLRAGKFVWCEKPLATTVEEGKRILKTAREYPQKLKVGSNVRFFPNVLKLKELIGSAIGTPMFFRGYIGNAGPILRGTSWQTQRELVGGGTLLDNGVHLIDLIRWLVGEVESCHATLSNNLWRLDGLEDLAICTFELSYGAKASMQSSWGEWVGYMYFEIYGTEGFIRSDNRFGVAKLTVGNRERTLQEYDYTSLSQVSYENELNHFLDRYSQSLEPQPNANDGYRAVRIVSACYESARSGKNVSCLDV